MHEMGHNLGLRHTEAIKREGETEYGLVQIPGTPENDSNSFMNSGTCGYRWTGLSHFDEIAFRQLWHVYYYRLSFFGDTPRSKTFRQGDSIQVDWKDFPSSIPIGKFFGGWCYDYQLTDKCRYGTYIKDNTILYPKWYDTGRGVTVTDFSRDISICNQYMRIERDAIVTVKVTVSKGLNEWGNISRYNNETGVIITSYGNWPYVTIQFWMEDFMLGLNIPTDPLITNTWKIYLPAGKLYIYNKICSQFRFSK